MATLFEISEELLVLSAQLEQAEGDVSESERIVNAWLQAVGDRDEKLDHYAALICELQARSEARKQEAKRLAERAKADLQRAQFLKTRLQQFFEVHRIKTLETPRYRLTLAQHGGPMPIRMHAEPEDLPEAFRIADTRYKADMDAIRAKLEQGEPLAFAEWGERKSSIRIR